MRGSICTASPNAMRTTRCCCFLRTAQMRRHKLVLVVTGKGARVAPDVPFDMELNYRSRGILKAVVPRWLREPAFAGIVAGTRARAPQAWRRRRALCLSAQGSVGRVYSATTDSENERKPN